MHLKFPQLEEAFFNILANVGFILFAFISLWDKSVSKSRTNRNRQILACNSPLHFSIWKQRYFSLSKHNFH